MFTDYELQIITGNVVYYTLLSIIRKVEDSEVVVYDLDMLKTLYKKVLKKMIETKKLEVANINSSLGFYITGKKMSIDKMTSLVAEDIETFANIAQGTAPNEMKVAKNVDPYVLLIIIDRTTKGVVEDKHTKETKVLIQNILTSVKKENAKFAKKVEPYIIKANRGFLHTLSLKSSTEQIRLLMEWIPSKDLTEFFDVVGQESATSENPKKEMRKSYALVMKDLYASLKKPIIKDLQYFETVLLPQVRCARKSFLKKQNRTEEEKDSYDFHIKYIKQREKDE
ncbi:MAG TPA: hypothetical protein VLE02_01090 [Nitrosarchaeum sp.]|nr:hypothetical protein [Nitrosarchaeum sp.]